MSTFFTQTNAESTSQDGTDGGLFPGIPAADPSQTPAGNPDDGDGDGSNLTPTERRLISGGPADATSDQPPSHRPDPNVENPLEGWDAPDLGGGITVPDMGLGAGVKTAQEAADDVQDQVTQQVQDAQTALEDALGGATTQLSAQVHSAESSVQNALGGRLEAARQAFDNAVDQVKTETKDAEDILGAKLEAARQAVDDATTSLQTEAGDVATDLGGWIQEQVQAAQAAVQSAQGGILEAVGEGLGHFGTRQKTQRAPGPQNQGPSTAALAVLGLGALGLAAHQGWI